MFFGGLLSESVQQARRELTTTYERGSRQAIGIAATSYS